MPSEQPRQPLLLINVVGLTPSLLGDATPNINALLKTAKMASLQPVFPAVTSSVQASILTGRPPSEHGIVGNGWYFRDQAEVRFWLQPNALIQGEKIWQTLQREIPGLRCSQLFWWFNMYAQVEAAITPRPHYPADGRKMFGLYSSPPGLHERIEQQIGEFPFPSFWGPAAGIASSRWIVDCAIAEFQISRPDLQLIYLPHLDYSLQRLGPEHPSISDEVRAIDHEVGRLLDFAQQHGIGVCVVTNAPRANAEHMLKVLGLQERFQTVLVAEELPRAKPDPLPYLSGLECLHATAEQALEEVAELRAVRAAEPGEVRAARAAVRAGRDLPGVAVRVVHLALLGVGQHGVGLADLLEPLGGLVVTGVLVGVVLLGELAVRALDVAFGGAPRYAQRVVIVFVRHQRPPRGYRN